MTVAGEISAPGPRSGSWSAALTASSDRMDSVVRHRLATTGREATASADGASHRPDSGTARRPPGMPG
jgi:hypothetical protein